MKTLIVLPSYNEKENVNRLISAILSLSESFYVIVVDDNSPDGTFDAVEEARKLQKKIAKNQFNFNDFLKQIQQIKKMGNVKDLMGMIPGVGKAIKDTDIDDDAFKGIEAIIYSMTMDERENPKILNGSRRKRIARGAGTDIQEVNRLIKQFAETSKMMKMMTTGGGRKMANMMNQLKK